MAAEKWRDCDGKRTAVYLVIGHESDSFSQRVTTALGDRGHEVVLTPEPFTRAGTLTWTLETLRSESQVLGLGGHDVPSNGLHGVFVRAFGAPLAHDEWAPEDFGYVQTETAAVLLAWLWDLPCRVVNRMSADLWFRPQRAYPEWHAMMIRCGLPPLATQLTNDLAAARVFADALGGTVTYAPLTAPTRYPVGDDRDWEELGKVMSLLPVSLVEYCPDSASYACLVGDAVIWDGYGDPRPDERVVFEDGLRRLAAMLRLHVLQIEVRTGHAGLRCSGVELYPQLATYDPRRREAIVAGVVDLLEGGS
jgi:hypothetical protein